MITFPLKLFDGNNTNDILEILDLFNGFFVNRNISLDDDNCTAGTMLAVQIECCNIITGLTDDAGDAVEDTNDIAAENDQGIGVIQSLHVYFMKYKFTPDKLGRAVILSEFGGYNYRVEGHSFNTRNFGYKHLKTPDELKNSLESLYKPEIFPAIKEGLAAAVYTQLSDVEDEVNGLITHDRAEIKLPAEDIRKIVEYKNT